MSWSISDRPSYDGVRAVDPTFQQLIDVLLEGMIAARGLTPLRLEASGREGWCDVIVRALLPMLEPTLPLFEGGPGS